MQALALRMLKGKRDVDDDKIDEPLARRQAHQLHEGAIDYIETLCDNSAPQNAMVAKYYEEAYNTSLKRALTQEYSGPVKDALLALLQGPAEWYALPPTPYPSPYPLPLTPYPLPPTAAWYALLARLPPPPSVRPADGL